MLLAIISIITLFFDEFKMYYFKVCCIFIFEEKVVTIVPAVKYFVTTSYSIKYGRLLPIAINVSNGNIFY